MSLILHSRVNVEKIVTRAQQLIKNLLKFSKGGDVEGIRWCYNRKKMTAKKKNDEEKTHKKRGFPFRETLYLNCVRLIGLEPTRREAPDPKSGVSTNFTTGAGFHRQRYNKNFILARVERDFHSEIFKRRRASSMRVSSPRKASSSERDT